VPDALDPDVLLAAYGHGIFPMPGEEGEVAWFSPDPRGVLFPSELRVSRSLARSRRRYEVRVDTAFEAVIDACASRDDPLTDWISPEIRDAYVRLHRLGHAHSVEAWREGELAGGLYGVALGGLFAGESMFSRGRDASKVALAGLVELVGADGLIDVQWLTPHLASLGAVEIPREEYFRRLDDALTRPLPPAFRRALSPPQKRHPQSG
jgi:leucyl/phenylalanyl-tRNA---protein transferase